MSLDAVWVVEGKHPMDRDWYPEGVWETKESADDEAESMVAYEEAYIRKERRCAYRVRRYVPQSKPPERGAK